MGRENVFRSCRHVLLLCAFLPAAFGQDPKRLESEATSLWASGHQAEAIAKARQAIPLLAGAPQARLLNIVGEMERLTGHADAAELLHRRALDVQPVALFANNLAEDLRTLGRLKEAAKYYAQAIEIMTGIDRWSPDLAIFLSNSACNLIYQGRPKEAEAPLRQALAIWEHVGPARITDAAVSWTNLALAYAQQKRYEEAEHWYARAREVWEQKLDSDHLRLALLYFDLASLYSHQKRYAEAEALTSRSIEILSRKGDANRRYYIEALQRHASLLKKLGRQDEARTVRARADFVRENGGMRDLGAMTVSIHSLR